MNMQDVVRIGEAWSSLGWAVQEQFARVAEGEVDPMDINPNALDVIESKVLPELEDIAFETSDDELERSVDMFREEMDRIREAEDGYAG